MKKTQFQGLIRHILTFGGGFLVAQGKIDELTLHNTVAAAMTVIGTIWSLSEKK